MLAALALAVATQVSPNGISRWSVHIAPARCLLERADPPTSTIVSIDTTPGSDGYRVTIVAPDVKASGVGMAATLMLGPAQKVITGYASASFTPDGRGVVSMQGIDASLLDDLAKASAVTITTKSLGVVKAEITNAAKAVDAFRRCVAEQLMEWGADPAQFAPGGTLPRARKERDDWLSDQTTLKIAGVSQRMIIDDDFRIDVGLDGTISGCRAVAPATEPPLEKAVCAYVEGKRLFDPARDPTGAAVRGAATFRVGIVRRAS